MDQAVKKIAISFLANSPFYFNDFFSLEIVENYGIAFGLPVNAAFFYILFVLFFIWLASGKLLDFNEMGKKDFLAVILILSGALGNLIDRIRFGYIIDFINFKNVVIFNLADVFIAAGVMALVGKFIQNNR